MASLLTGCETGELGGNSSPSNTGAALSGNRYFAHEISLGVDGTASTRLEQQGLRARDFDPGDIVQNVLTPTGEKEVPLDPGPGGVLLAYAPLDIDKSTFRWVRNWQEVLPSSGDTYGRSTGSRTIIWTVPEYDPVENPILFSAFGQSGVLTGRSVTINETWSFENHDDNGLDPSQKSPPEVTVQIGGVDFGSGPSSFSGMHTAHYQFSSTLPGLHSVENQVVNGDGTGLEGNWSYYQRRMEFAEEFPEYDDSTTEPVEIQNSLQWNDGSAAGEAEWEVSVGDLRKEGTGSVISAVWKPVEETLERYVDPATLPVKDTLQRTPLSVKARTPAFSQRWDETGPLYYQISGGTDVPERTRIKIIEEIVSPPEPFEGDSTSATVTAEVIFFDPELIPQDINWQVDIKNSAGEVVWNKLATGTGCDISAVWDGTIKGDPLPADDNDPKTYSFALSAFLCAGDGGVVVTGRALDVRTQGLGSEECSPDPKALAQVGVSVGNPPLSIEIQKIDQSVLTSSKDKLEYGGPFDLALLSRGTVYPDETYRLVARGIGPHGSEPPVISVNLAALGSQRTTTLELPKSSEDDKIIYFKTFTLADFPSDSLTSSSFTVVDALLSDKFDLATSTSTLDQYSGAGTLRKAAEQALEFISLQLNSSATPLMRYGFPTRQFGYYSPIRPDRSVPTPDGGASDEKIRREKAEAILSPAEILNGPGFETVVAQIDKVHTDGETVETLIKIRKPSDMLVSAAHGATGGALILDQANNSFLDPYDPSQVLNAPNLKTWAFLDCLILDMYDFNNNKIGRGGRTERP